MAAEVFTWDVIGQCRRVATSGAAHAMLAAFRQEATGDRLPDRKVGVTVEALDLTDGQRFDWQAYLAGHPEGREIVGGGVTKFELRFLAAIDPNHQQRRLDFIVHRVDLWQPHVRLHPHTKSIKRTTGVSSKEAIPVYGNLADWTGERIPWVNPGPGDGAALPVAVARQAVEARPVLMRAQADTAVPRQDVIGRRRAYEFLQDLNRDRQRRWFVDLTNDAAQFPWHRYLQSAAPLQDDAPKNATGCPPLPSDVEGKGGKGFCGS